MPAVTAPPDQIDWLEREPECLSDGFPERMVLLDVETTGGKATYHRIIEIGLLVVEDGAVVEEWQTFVNPETHLPAAIQQLTGIRPADLVDAPLFAEIANELLERLQERVLVAHNARFDYGFLKNEFARAGIDYSSKPLCSVKVSRQLFPGYKRHGLSTIIRRFGFPIANRHRALDDARIIWRLFLKASGLFDADEIAATCNDLLKRPTLPPYLDAGEVDRLPGTPGVYRFYASNGQLLYVGKSVNLRRRVLSHFQQDYRNHKDLKMSAQIAQIDFTPCPSDFGAQLLESEQIKALKPLYNRRLTRVMKLYHYQLAQDAQGYLRVRIAPLEQQLPDMQEHAAFGLFRSRRQAEKRLEKLAKDFFLCQTLTGLQAAGSRKQGAPCFAYQLKRCFGACCEQEAPQEYNARLLTALKDYRVRTWPWAGPILLEERGALPAEEAHYHLIDQWRYLQRITSEQELLDLGYQPAASPQPDEVEQGEVEQHQDNQREEALTVDTESLIDFDLDLYFILVRFLFNEEQMRANTIRIVPLAAGEQEW